MRALSLLSIVSLASASYPAPGPCSGDCWTHDPSMIQRASDGAYFRFSTGSGVNTMTSPSIEGPWQDVGAALPDGSIIKLNDVDSMNIWAPDLHYADGTYYMYYVLSKLGTQNSQVGVATSKTLEPGSWTDHGAIGLPANNAYNRIDPNWIAIDGKEYLQFGSYWKDLFQVELDSPLKVGSVPSHQLTYNASLNHREEAAFMFQHGSYYYLLYSGGLAGSYTATSPPQGEEYRIHVCRSTTGLGGFVDKSGTSCLESGGSILLQSHDQIYAPGGQGFLNDREFGPVLYYQYYPLALKEAGGNGDAGYLYGWNQLGWEDDWPYVKETAANFNTAYVYDGDEDGPEETGSEQVASLEAESPYGAVENDANVKIT
ncbi:hypothetical protein N7478_011120 [Penicillium angulare]|uniref:uncharacterized protein n=1 Tax=Penicillium angulare TaxID=116970 RepID=UPI002541287A|nr:uncharacterized protein N7478_011120 [Penicillium angulare]KAJ5263515.1 hypothetical protein N7478_011120 [Penicillium angulare]